MQGFLLQNPLEDICVPRRLACLFELRHVKEKPRRGTNKIWKNTVVKHFFYLSLSIQGVWLTSPHCNIMTSSNPLVEVVSLWIPVGFSWEAGGWATVQVFMEGATYEWWNEKQAHVRFPSHASSCPFWHQIFLMRKLIYTYFLVSIFHKYDLKKFLNIKFLEFLSYFWNKINKKSQNLDNLSAKQIIINKKCHQYIYILSEERSSYQASNKHKVTISNSELRVTK